MGAEKTATEAAPAPRRRHPLLAPAILAISALVLVAKIALLLHIHATNPEAFLSNDSESYIVTATELVTLGSFTQHGVPEALRTPGYPIYLAPFVMAFGERFQLFALLGQIVLGFVVAYIVYEMASLAFGSAQVATAAYVVVLLEPTLTRHQYLIMTEIVFLVCLMGGLYFLVRFQTRPALAPLILGAVLITASAFVRPVSVYVNYLLLAFCAVHMLGRRNWILLAAAVVLASLHFGAIGAWAERNHREAGIDMFSTGGAIYAFEVIGPHIVAGREGRPVQEVQREFAQRLEGMGEIERTRYSLREGRQIILDAPLQAARVWIKGAAYGLLGPGTGQWANILRLGRPGTDAYHEAYSRGFLDLAAFLAREKPTYLVFSIAGAAWLVVFYLTALAAIVRRPFDPPTVMLLLAALYFLAVSSAPQAYSRFRVPYTPLVAMWSAYGMCWFWRLARRRGQES